MDLGRALGPHLAQRVGGEPREPGGVHTWAGLSGLPSWLREPGVGVGEYRPRGVDPWAYTLLLPLLAP